MSDVCFFFQINGELEKLVQNEEDDKSLEGK